jgi:cysteine desulfurase
MAWVDATLPVDAQGRVTVDDPAATTLQWANSETGVVQELPKGLAVSDVTQGFGKLPFSYSWAGVGMVFLSAHKIGGPKGVGALVIPQGYDLAAQIRGGGQEMGRRSGTENVIGIAGFGAAAQAAMRDLANGTWEAVASRRDLLEEAIVSRAKDTIFVGKGATRLPGTSCRDFRRIGLFQRQGAHQSGVDRDGSGADVAGSAIRVSLGPQTSDDDVLRFADAWCAKQARTQARVA